ncbi:NAD(P)/FAD-dependent oxidoreductase [Oceaniglobus indicus]|uniref:NAD(P)/FAD-dependent oxidoreductase n=1 Tax=Oceaniglobus indicus TaxID=2047749 RepID=UPI000C1817F0|nr:FAD-binding oxidoreductase [Oceaniglobus indicus]
MSRIVIIGGGIAGLSAAARLAPLGQVTVLEAEPALATHASGRSAAAFIEDYGNATVRALNRASLRHLSDHAGGVLSRRGVLLVARADQADSFASDRIDMGMDDISVPEACDMVPILNRDTVAHAAYRADVMDLDTDLLIQNFTRDARASGARIVTGVRVDAIARANAGWTVRWKDGVADADIVVNAAGAWADHVARMAGIAPLGLQPYRRSMAQLPAPEGHDVTAWPLFEGVDSAWYAKPGAGKLTVSPAEEDPMDAHDAFTDDMVVAEGLARYSEMVTTPVTRVETTWAGLRTFAPDRALVIGPDATMPSFFWCAAQGGYGFQTAPAASQLLGDLVAGRAPELPGDVVTALSPARFG